MSQFRITSRCDACNGRGSNYYEPCHDCFGQGEIPDYAATMDAYDAREPLVQAVIEKIRAIDSRSGWSSQNDRNELYQAARKLAEWKP